MSTQQSASPEVTESLHERVLDWYAANARDLPWRRPDATPWAVMVSEFMLQQTPVSRVLPVYEDWIARWPAPEDLVAAGPGEAVRAWGRLGYPRRALRPVEAARSIVDDHDGVVPDGYEALRALPGVGDYTAAAVASFAFGRRHVVLDTNVRRVLARCLSGDALPPVSATRAERVRAEAVLPEDPATAARWAVGVMELGALVCIASNPRCQVCPLQDSCRWQLEGRPAHTAPARRVQTYAGTDRQCRGRLLEVLRTERDPVLAARLDAAWDDGAQRARCLASLIDDGLVVRTLEDTYALP